MSRQNLTKKDLLELIADLPDSAEIWIYVNSIGYPITDVEYDGKHNTVDLINDYD